MISSPWMLRIADEHPRSGPRIISRDRAPVVDEPPGFRVIGAPPGAAVKLSASCVDPDGVEFVSWAEYVADANGAVDPTVAYARSGTYRGVDPYGLWWSMTSRPERAFGWGLAPIETVIIAMIGGEEVARIGLARRRVHPEIRVEPVRDDGLVGTLFVPRAAMPVPGALVLGGSEGGIAIAEELAALLATRGFSSLALAYFGCESLPPRFVEIPVEYVQRAAQWFSRRSEISPDGIGVVGVSRGAELALLLATLERVVRAVVGFSASGVVWPGFVLESMRARSAWTRAGKPLPFAMPRPIEGESNTLAWQAAALDDRRTEHAVLALDQIAGAVLLISGGDDGLWPARRLAEAAMGRLVGEDPNVDRHRHLHYPEAGHGVGRLLGLPAAPTSSTLGGHGRFRLGGTRSANASSARDAWPQVLAFLARHLAAPPNGDAKSGAIR